MAGMFDDLIPQGGPDAAPAGGGGMFDDLIPAPKSESTLDYATGLAQKAAQGATLGFGDEIAAAMGSGFGLGHNVGLKDYSEILGDVRGKEKGFEQQHPIASKVAEVAGSVPTAIGAGAALKALPYAGQIGNAIDKIPGLIPRAAVRGAAIGAPYGAVTQVGNAENLSSSQDYLNSALQGAKSGAEAGAILTPALEGAGKGIAAVAGPWASEQAQKLIGQGVPLTIGETLGGGAKFAEDVASRFPLAGMMVRKAQQKSIEGLNRTAVNRALAPIGESLDEATPVGHEALKEASTKISNAYNQILPKMVGKVDKPLTDDIAEIRAGLTPSMTQDFDHLMQRNIIGAADDEGALSGQRLKRSFSAISDKASKLSKDPDAFKQELGQSLFDVRNAMLDMAERHNGSGLVQDLRNTDKAFAMLARPQKAASNVLDTGMFTPAQLHRAVGASDRTARKRAFVEGDALMQDLSEPAKKLMTSKIPNSGTPERLMWDSLLHLGLHGAGVPLVGLAPEAGIAGLYTGPAQSALRYMATASPETRTAISNALSKYATQFSAPTGAAVGYGYQQ